MDWTGQKLAESLCIYLTLGFGLVAFVAGYARQDFGLMMKIYGAGVALTGLATIPNWPWLNRNPLTWLPVEKKEEKKENEGEDDNEDEGDDDDEGTPSDEKNNSSPSLKTTTRRAATQRRQPVIE